MLYWMQATSLFLSWSITVIGF